MLQDIIMPCMSISPTEFNNIYSVIFLIINMKLLSNNLFCLKQYVTSTKDIHNYKIMLDFF